MVMSMTMNKNSFIFIIGEQMKWKMKKEEMIDLR